MGKTVNRSDPYARTTWRGKPFDERTKSALIWAEKRYLVNQRTGKRRGKWRQEWHVSQGSYSHGSLSAGTHSQGGAVDIGFAGLNKKQRKAVVKWLKRAGFAAWAREGGTWAPNNEHCHAILRGHRNLDDLAEQQVRDFDNGRSGLVGNAADNTWRPDPKRRWSHRQNRPIDLDD